MTPQQLSAAVVESLSALVAAGELDLPEGVPAEVTIERPRQRSHGDYATNVALQLAKGAGTNPRAFAELVAERTKRFEGIRLTAHHYPELRAVADAVPEATLRLSPEEAARAHASDWASLLSL